MSNFFWNRLSATTHNISLKNAFGSSKMFTTRHLCLTDLVKTYGHEIKELSTNGDGKFHVFYGGDFEFHCIQFDEFTGDGGSA